MKKDWISYVGTMVILFGLIALFASDLSMIIGAVIFAFSGVGMPFGAIAALSLICMGIFAIISSDIAGGIILSLGFIIPGLLMGYMIRKKSSLSMIIGIGTFFRALLTTLYYYRISLLEATTIRELLTGVAFSGLEAEFSNAGLSEEVKLLMEKSIEFAKDIIPSTIIISSLGFAFMTLLATKLMLRKMPGVFSGIRRLRNIKMDASVTVCTILLFIGMFFVEGEFLKILINLNYLLYTIYAYSGFAFILRNIKRGIKSEGLSLLLTVVTGAVSFGLLYVISGLIGSFIPIKEEFIKEKEEQIQTGKDE